MKKKTIKEFRQDQERSRARQRQYKRENPEVVLVWRQTTYANFLRKHGWKVIPPDTLKTSEDVRAERDRLERILEEAGELGIDPIYCGSIRDKLRA